MFSLEYVGDKKSPTFIDGLYAGDIPSHMERKKPENIHGDFDFWVERVMDGFGLSLPKVSYVLHYGSIPKWIFEADEGAFETLLKGKLNEVSLLRDVDLRLWVEKHYYDDVDFDMFFRGLDFFRRGYDKYNYMRLESLLDPLYIGNLASRIPNVDVFCKMDNEEVLKLTYGKATRFIDEVPYLMRANWVRYNETDDNIADEVDVRYLDFNTVSRKHSVADVLKAGVKPTTLFPNVTRKEANHMAQVCSSMYFKTHETILYRKAFNLDVELEGLRYANDVVCVKWAIRNKEKLKTVREIRMPGNRVVNFYNHVMLMMFDKDILPKGEYTGWKKVMSAIDDTIQRKIDEQLKVNRPLPKFPIEGFVGKGVIQLDTTHALREEGNRMGHCVGSYIDACVEEQSYIFHIESDGKGTTVELSPSDDGSWVVSQSMGPGNTPDKETAEWLKERLLDLGYVATNVVT